MRLSPDDPDDRLWADGPTMDTDKVVAVEAKYVGKPGTSPYEGAVQPPFMQGKTILKFDDERAATVRLWPTRPTLSSDFGSSPTRRRLLRTCATAQFASCRRARTSTSWCRLPHELPDHGERWHFRCLVTRCLAGKREPIGVERGRGPR